MGKQIYYHFLSSGNAVHDLERKMIRVSTLDKLNDPFELMPYLRYFDRKKRKQYLEIRKRISKKYGLLCFSKTWTEPLLWSHYADKHKGIALGFEISDPTLIDVDYSTSPLRRQIDLTDNPSTDEELLLKLARIKYKNWGYELESRILIKLEHCTYIEDHYFIPFSDTLKVAEVRLGSLFVYDNSTEFYICKLAEDLEAEVIPSRLQWQGYMINRDGYRADKLRNTNFKMGAKKLC